MVWTLGWIFERGGKICGLKIAGLKRLKDWSCCFDSVLQQERVLFMYDKKEKRGMLLIRKYIGNKKRKFLPALILFVGVIFLLSDISVAQTTKVKGRVTDAKTGESIPFVSVFFKNTTIGVSTDLDGYYIMETRKTTDGILCAMIIGYDQQEFPIVK